MSRSVLFVPIIYAIYLLSFYLHNKKKGKKLLAFEENKLVTAVFFLMIDL